MTETITHGIVGDLHFPNASLSCGRPAPEYEIAVLDDDGVPVDPGETGHLLIRGIRGVSLFLEYLDNPEATRDSFDEAGWFRTGDRVRPMPDGHVFFADRDKDMLNVGGENVAASEIEAVIITVCSPWFTLSSTWLISSIVISPLPRPAAGLTTRQTQP